mgnify:CR=1 FL=1
MNLPMQTKEPQSPGSRGLKMNKLRPGKRYYDSLLLKLKQLRK